MTSIFLEWLRGLKDLCAQERIAQRIVRVQAGLLGADAFEAGDSAYIAHALGVVAKARGMASITRDAGVTREALYKALSETGDPQLSTLLGVVKALGLRLSATSEARTTPAQ